MPHIASSSAFDGSTSGWVVKRTCSQTYSLGSRLTQGTSSRTERQFLSSRQRTPGSQAKPPSMRTSFSLGKRSNTPWQIIETRFDANTWGISVWCSM